MSEQQHKICPYCREKIMAKAIKCKHCKSLITKNGDVVQPNREPRGETSKDMAAGELRTEIEGHSVLEREEKEDGKCKQCGAQIDRTGYYCPNCGFPVKEVIVATPADRPEKPKSRGRLFLWLWFAALLIIIVGMPTYNTYHDSPYITGASYRFVSEEYSTIHHPAGG